MKRALTLFLFFALAFCVINLLTAKAQENVWTAIAPMPTPEMQLGVAVVNGTIYAIGGSATSPNGLDTNQKYDTDTNIWTTLASMPTPRYNLGVAVYQNIIYCIGGINTGPHLNTTEMYDIATDTWETKASLPINSPTIYCANAVEGKIYVMGLAGENQTALFNQAYDPATDTWAFKTVPSTNVIGDMSAVLDGKIYMFGGEVAGNPSASLNQIYNPTTDSWTTAKPLPMFQSNGAAAATSGLNASKRLYVMGGETTYVMNGVTFGNFTDANNIYNPETDTWSKGATMPSVLRFFKLAVVNDQLYAVGGVKGLLSNFPDQTARYTPIQHDSAEQEPIPFYMTPIGTAIIILALSIIIAIAIFYFKPRKAKNRHGLSVKNQSASSGKALS